MPDCLSRLFLCFYLLCTVTLVVSAQQQVVLGSTNPDIVYLPALCNVSDMGCLSAWQIYIDFPSINGTPAIATGTTGPIPQTGNTVPQLFLTFRASALYLLTSPLSNATVNFSLTADPSGVTITKQVNTNISKIIIADNLPETQTTTLGVTFLQGPSLTRFDVESITLNVTNSSATSSYLPTLSLPTSSFPPSISPTSTSTVNSNTNQRTVTIVGATLGGVLGPLAISSAGIFVYRRWRRRRIKRSEGDAGIYGMMQQTAKTR
ncbi:hypothetical protein DEU56DRAFT_732819 [Suillus clintonianus]|uniref:uncharacterized protein n=1 Tax=Suillus clintonianus TaxID=1904413 RepID=UPI001B8702EC|nr:uncharacterized protein DEU56DRAFT_732819 [Suillus clintonianus]KAG2144280.1 hypothetical protein DEU56DRAFT_732819 [Suillus clintonianus]